MLRQSLCRRSWRRVSDKSKTSVVKSYEEIEKETRLSFQNKFNISSKASDLKADLINNEQWSKSRDMKMVPRQRFAYAMALMGTAFFIILVKEVNTVGGYFYRDEAFQGMDSTVHTWEDREARYKIEDYKRKFREIENKSNR